MSSRWVYFGISVCFCLVFLALTAAMVKETWDLYHGNDPLTNVLRKHVRAYPKTATGFVVGVGALFGHFLWR